MSYNTAFISSHALNASFNSAAQLVSDAGLYSIQLVFTGSTCSFSMKLQVSSDPYDASTLPTNFDDYPSSSVTIAAAGTYTYNVSSAGYSYVRMVITDGSSGANTGTITARINVKGPL